jgi:hypothetical protein
MASATEGAFCPDEVSVLADRAEGASKESELSRSVRVILESSLPSTAYAPRVVVYGYNRCSYEYAFLMLRDDVVEKRSCLEDCYAFSNISDGLQSGLEYFDRRVDEIDGHLLCRSLHSTGYLGSLLTICLENCKRVRRGELIIPALFCIASSFEEGTTFSYENVHQRVEGNRRAHTSRELNLVYKLCYGDGLSAEIHEVARKMFIFVKTIIPLGERVPVRLEDTGIRIDDSWHAALKKDHHKERDPAKHDWRAWMLSELAKYHPYPDY